MQKVAKFTGLSGKTGWTAVSETTETSCQCPTVFQWKTSTNYTTPEPAWSLQPLSFSSNDNQPCSCLGYKNMDFNINSIEANSNLESNKDIPARKQASASISKNLKFGIERILTPNCKEERNSGRYCCIGFLHSNKSLQSSSV